MDSVTLRKVQMVLLEIAKEIKRVCDENNIKYFLDSGTLLGAIRHKGFIPWDDDLDIGMMREDYEKFCNIAPKCLNENYFLQTWKNDTYYGLPFAKVRKKNTVYVENKASKRAKNGFYVDVFPYDYAPESFDEKEAILERLANLERLILMKCLYEPWNEADRINLFKRIGYIPYQIFGIFKEKSDLIQQYEALAKSVSKSSEIYLQFGSSKGFLVPYKAFGDGIAYTFEDDTFRIPEDYDLYLTSMYGDYMTLPPVEERENRHQIIDIKF